MIRVLVAAASILYATVDSRQKNVDEAPVWSTEDTSTINDNNSSVVISSRINYELSKNDIATQIFNDCECVMYYLCDNENYIITDGKGLINVR